MNQERTSNTSELLILVLLRFKGIKEKVIATFRERAQRSSSDKVKVASISSVAMKEEGSDIVEVRLKNQTQDELETLLKGEVLSFKEQSWMDMKGVFIFSPINSNVTVMFPSGAGVEVRAISGFLSVSVLLPELFQNKTEGLLGVMNNDREDDFTMRNGTQLPSSATPQEIFNFGADCKYGQKHIDLTNFYWHKYCNKYGNINITEVL
ncbi:unnamed protein product [Ranitomeya imitator]|uniref:VWFD domain-containing protein n=1 Tax=Ranitomeya imitator TaxID=111125 RepID=A0ABN9M5K8_9NEOB|nr:unnamed protein product [Ranitomeya imitator]